MRVGVVNGIIYAIGGYDGSAHLNTVECFDPMTNAWKPVASMASRRSSAGVTVLNDMLYVVGELHAMYNSRKYPYLLHGKYFFKTPPHPS